MRGKEACEIAGITNTRFNELVHRGGYPNPPPTTRGSYRTFNPNALAKLCLYASLLKVLGSPKPTYRAVKALWENEVWQPATAIKIEIDRKALIKEVEHHYE